MKNFNNYLLTAFFAFSLGSTFSADVANSEITQHLTQPVNPKTTVIAFDLHEVLFDRLSWQMSWRCFTSLFRGMAFYAFNPVFWYRARTYHNQVAVMEYVYQKLTIDYPYLLNFKDDFLEVSNAYTPNLPMVALFEQLAAAGYDLFILSNIGSQTLPLLKKKYPEILSVFKGEYIPCTENDYLAKPDIRFYEAFKNYLHEQGHGHKQCIFIDDKKVNIEGARKAGIASIHAPSADHVKEALISIKAL